MSSAHRMLPRSAGPAARWLGAVAAVTAVLVAGACGSSKKDDKPSADSPTSSASSGGSTNGDALTVPMTVVGKPATTVATFVTVKLAGKPYEFTVDTGATRTVVDTSVAGALHLPKAGPSEKSSTLTCTTSVQPVTINSWSLGGRELPKATISSQKIPDAGKKVGGAPYAGLLGADVLSTFNVLSLDFRNAKLTLGGDAPDGGKSAPLIIRTIKGQVLTVINLTVAGKRGSWVLDTGANTTAVDSKAAKLLKLAPVGKPVTVGTIACKSTAQPVKIPSWSAGTVKLPQALALSAPSELSKQTGGGLIGLLGENVLASYGRTTIDFTGKKITFGE